VVDGSGQSTVSGDGETRDFAEGEIMGIIENAKELADLLIELTRQNRQLEDKVEEQKKLLDLKGKMKWEKPVYRTEGEEDPYCPQCWEVSQKQVHLRKWQYGNWFCHNCKKVFQ